MRVSAKTDYALRALIEMAVRDDASPISAEELGRRFGLDVTDPAFWTASLDVCRDRIAQYEALAAEVA